MAGLTIGWEYLTGYAVATDPANRAKAEWPPHPARVFMAMAAAWFETGEESTESRALRWLEEQGDPELELPANEAVYPRTAVTAYVPVNDKAGPSAAPVQSAPSLTRSKQPRTFPCMRVADTPCFMHWPHADAPAEISSALDTLCSKVTRIGHSSSLVRMWVANGPEQVAREHSRFVTDEIDAEFHARQISEGFLDTLVENYGAAPRRHAAQLENLIGEQKAAKKLIKGKGTKERKAAIDQEIDRLQNERDGLIERPPVRPKVGLWSGYRNVHLGEAPQDATNTCFAPELLILTRTTGPDLSLTSTLALTQALRATVMKHCMQPPPSWVCGHEPDGTPSQAQTGHLACLPLAFTSHEHADGHILGLGLALPRNIDRRERGRVLGPVLLRRDGEPREVRLVLGRLGAWAMHKAEWSEQRGSLQAATWTAASGGASTWASVTPVVLDRFPKSDRDKDKRAWREEVARIVIDACARIGLPEPESVDIDTTSWHRGSPRAYEKRRLLRGSQMSEGNQTVGFGDGFPRYPAKGTKVSRPQVHVWLHFREPVVGPVLLGAGRFLGYGLLKPCKEGVS